MMKFKRRKGDLKGSNLLVVDELGFLNPYRTASNISPDPIPRVGNVESGGDRGILHRSISRRGETITPFLGLDLPRDNRPGGDQIILSRYLMRNDRDISLA